MTRRPWELVCCACWFVLAGCGDTQRSAPADGSGERLRFTDVTAGSGLELTLVSGAAPARQLIESMGAGVGLIDYDRDGDLDVFAPNGATLDTPRQGPGCRLFENRGELQFVDVTQAAGLTWSGWGMAVAVGDADGDGWDDLYVCAFGDNALLRNTGDGRFEDVTEVAGVGDERWAAAAAFGDIDNDGDLDLYVVNYFFHDLENPPPYTNFKGVAVPRGPEGMRAQADVLYENDGDGSFSDITALSGCGDVSPAYGLGVVMLDFDGDGQLEIFVGNDSQANFLFDDARGDATPVSADAAPDTAAPGRRRLVDTAALMGVGLSSMGREQATMGIAVADVDGNGYADLFTTNFSSDTNTLHTNLDGVLFEDRTARFGLSYVSRPYLGWSAMFFDFDHDADEDLLLFNGHVFPMATKLSMDSEARQPPLLFAREGPVFEPVGAASAGAWLGEPHNDRGAAFGDLDADGDVDVVVAELSGPLRLLRNDSEKAGTWISLALRDERPGARNRNGIGARVELAGGDPQRRWIFSGGGYASASAPHAHFGLPAGTSGVDLTIHWPDGRQQRLSGLASGRHHVVERRD